MFPEVDYTTEQHSVRGLKKNCKFRSDMGNSVEGKEVTESGVTGQPIFCLVQRL